MKVKHSMHIIYIHWVIIVKVSKRYKERTTDQNDVKFEWNIIEGRGKTYGIRKK